MPKAKAANKKKVSKKTKTVTEKLLAEQEVTNQKNAELHEKAVAEEEAKVKAAIEAAENQAPPINHPKPLPNKELEKAWEEHLKAYKEQNPVKYASKEKAGAFKQIPAGFTGTNHMVL